MIVAYFPLKNYEESLQLFNEINRDSSKNKPFISLNSFDQVKIAKFRSLLRRNYKKYFSTRKTLTGKMKCIEEFVEELYKIGFLKYSIDFAFAELQKYNKLFFQKAYQIYSHDAVFKNLFYKKEGEVIIGKRVVFTTKQNNFIHSLYFSIMFLPGFGSEMFCFVTFFVTLFL